MEIKIISFLSLLAYSALVSQSFSYIIALRNLQENVGATTYIEIRKLLDKNFRAKFSIVFYSTFSCTVAMVLVTIWKGSGFSIITSTLALIAFMIDALLMIKGNMPLNNLINTWTPAQYPDDWQQYRKRWLDVFRFRQIANLTGFIALLAGVVFE